MEWCLGDVLKMRRRPPHHTPHPAETLFMGEKPSGVWGPLIALLHPGDCKVQLGRTADPCQLSSFPPRSPSLSPPPSCLHPAHTDSAGSGKRGEWAFDIKHSGSRWHEISPNYRDRRTYMSMKQADVYCSPGFWQLYEWIPVKSIDKNSGARDTVQAMTYQLVHGHK